MSVIDDILDDEKEFYLETEDKIKLYCFNFFLFVAFSMLTIACFGLLLQGLKSFIDALVAASVLCIIGIMIYIFSSALRSVIFGYKKLKIDKNGNFILAKKNGYSQKISAGSIKNIIITDAILWLLKGSGENCKIIKIINKNGKKYHIVVSSIGGFPTEDELPCKIKYEKVTESIPKNYTLFCLRLSLCSHLFFIYFFTGDKCILDN